MSSGHSPKSMFGQTVSMSSGGCLRKGDGPSARLFPLPWLGWKMQKHFWAGCSLQRGKPFSKAEAASLEPPELATKRFAWTAQSSPGLI